MKRLVWRTAAILLIICAMSVQANAQMFDFGDAPEGAVAYPAVGIMGMFPTCMNVTLSGWIQHGWGPPPWAFFGPLADLELEGNAGMCPSFGYDSDECFADGDAGLLFPTAFTIIGAAYAPCPNVATTSTLGPTCTSAAWGANIDIMIQETAGINAFVNVLIDWNQSGNWGGFSTCPGGINAPEHVLINFLIPANFSGPLSMLMPPGFLIGPIPDFVWVRFSITYLPVTLPWDGSGSFEDGESEDYLLLIDPLVPPTATPTYTPEPSPTQVEEWGDYGDAPENALAYPSMGGFGFFPSCLNTGPSGWIQHLFAGMFFGPNWDMEPEGNAGACPVFTNQYDQDECMNDGDAGLILPGSFTIIGSPGAETEAPCPLSGGMGIPLGNTCQTAIWGPQIDIHIQEITGLQGFVNVIIDWDQNGVWGGNSICSGGITVPEHILVNFPIPPWFSGPISALTPPTFLIGPNNGFVWTRFTISDLPMPLPWEGSGYSIYGESEDYLLFIEQEFMPTATPTSTIPTATPTGEIPSPTPTPSKPIPTTGPAGSVLLIVLITVIIGFLPCRRK